MRPATTRRRRSSRRRWPGHRSAPAPVRLLWDRLPLGGGLRRVAGDGDALLTKDVADRAVEAGPHVGVALLGLQVGQGGEAGEAAELMLLAGLVGEGQFLG